MGSDDSGEGTNARAFVSVIESVKISDAVEAEYDECPECGGEYIDIDTALTGVPVFIHDEDPLESCSSEEAYTQVVDGRDW